MQPLHFRRLLTCCFPPPVQPLASALVQGVRDVEVRTFQTSAMGGLWLCVHAGKSSRTLSSARLQAVRRLWPDMPPKADLLRQTGCMLGFVRVRAIIPTTVAPAADNPWVILAEAERGGAETGTQQPTFAWLVDKAVQLPQPIPLPRGQLRIWWVTSDLSGQLEAALAAALANGAFVSHAGARHKSPPTRALQSAPQTGGEGPALASTHVSSSQSVVPSIFALLAKGAAGNPPAPPFRAALTASTLPTPFAMHSQPATLPSLNTGALQAGWAKMQGTAPASAAAGASPTSHLLQFAPDAARSTADLRLLQRASTRQTATPWAPLAGPSHAPSSPKPTTHLPGLLSVGDGAAPQLRGGWHASAAKAAKRSRQRDDSASSTAGTSSQSSKTPRLSTPEDETDDPGTGAAE